jgi:hypothetical protein
MLKYLGKIFLKSLGWSTPGRLVVLQSDDWGSLRTSSTAALDQLRGMDVKVDACHYMLYDSLERSIDLESVFDVLRTFNDRYGRHPVLTANCLVSNPDFDRIRQSGFSQYVGQPMTSTLSITPGAESNMILWRQAVECGVCQPQSHGREHLNIARWMSDLSKGDMIALTAFDHSIFGVSSHTTTPRRQSYLASFDFEESSGQLDKATIVAEALQMFESTFGFKSRSFIAPNYVWDSQVERSAKAYGVDYLQSGPIQWIPSTGNGKQMKRKRRFQGQKNAFDQRYLVRNVLFEPSSDPSLDWVGLALKEIDLAFKLRKPAVISTHRVNFIGALSPANRDRGLTLFKNLLKEMLVRWPDIAFMDTVELGQRMAGSGAPQ